MTASDPHPHPYALCAAGELAAWRRAVSWIDPEHLPELRAHLRDVREWPNLSESLRLERAYVLDAVCRRLIASVPDWRHAEQYLIGVGDMFPTVPDTIGDIA